MQRQKTIREAAGCSGTGLHTGKPVNIRILPADEDSGISFVRTDIPGRPVIKAASENVVDTRLATTIGRGSVTISTVEHLLAAFYGMGIDNAIVEVGSCEIPIMDGSAEPFVNLIREVGMRAQRKPKKFIIIKKPIKVRDGKKVAILLPARDFKITYSITFEHSFLSGQSFSKMYSDKIFINEICGAKTFGFLKEVEWLRSQGLAIGGSLENAIVIGDTSIINADLLRYPDEFVRHKVLDCIGDLSLLGAGVIGHIIADKSGHSLNQRLVRKVIESPSRWSYAEIPANGDDEEYLYSEVGISPSLCYAAS
ncbi:MAG: UDP-3-O-[3-hydroxymyristoyl] N-acetylglucosamine deacetylase [Deltaproteobacteria bacterium GWC2_42_11]|nr:MAG: UDP-3-O-[3-hydroxymyristoyl] N-acetylglucosamine deacetylase [Deltaproteobacteria bacterium GWC2_42_11]